MGADFTTLKQVGTAAELALCDLLTAANALVTCNQVNRDSVQDHPGAAVAHDAAGTLHLPDLSIVWPKRSIGRRMHIESKAKSPLRKGGWGWDRHAFDRAMHWNMVTGEPVLYCIRDLSSRHLPALGQRDDPDCWWFASVWKLAHAASRLDSGPMIYWSAEEFLPLGILLEGIYDVAMVPCVYVTDGGAPLVL